MIVTVTAQDIENGVPKSSSFCPVAAAIGRLFPGCKVVVGAAVFIFCPGGTVRFPLPAAVQQAISLYDLTGVMAPGWFALG